MLLASYFLIFIFLETNHLVLIFSLLSLLPLALTVLPFFRHEHWIIRLGDFPRAQIVAVSLLLLFFILQMGVTRHWILPLLGACLLAVIFYQLATMLPYTVLYKKQVLRSKRGKTDASISIIEANVLMTNRKVKQLKKMIARYSPDLILLVETDAWWENEMRYLKEQYNSFMLCPLENTYGMVLYSRLALENTEVKWLVESDIPSIHTLVKLSSGHKVQLFCLHPRPPVPNESPSSLERDAELLIVAKEVKEINYPVIVTGDLNDVAWSATTTLFRKISGLLDPRIGRGLFNTFHANYPFLRMPLDHVFHSSDFRLLRLKRLPYFGSDHFPIFVELSYEPKQAAAQETPAPTTEELAEADEKIEKALTAQADEETA